jgi:YggT family protein
VDVTGQVLEGLLFCFIALLWIRLVADLVQAFARSWHPRGPFLVVLEAVYSATDLAAKPVRRVVPTLRVRGVQIDLSLWLLLVAAYLLRALVRTLFL